MINPPTPEERQAMKEAREAAIQKFIGAGSTNEAAYLKRVPKGCQNLFLKILTATATKRESIKGKCLDCSCFDKSEITKCSMTVCPLHVHRPYQSSLK